MIDLYYQTAKEIGYSNPPPVLLKTLPTGTIAMQIRSWVGRETDLRSIRDRVEIDPIQIADYNEQFIIAHELTHWRARSFVGGGGLTSDGQNHNASFLAGWLVMLKRLGCDEKEVEGAAYWHGAAYKMHPEHIELAIKSAAATDNPDKAISLATIYPKTPLKEKVILTVAALAFLTYLLNSIFQTWR
jgi:hypothetical protein